jgi:hypothetical protein
MELEPHIDTLREQLAMAAEAGGEDTRALVQRLTAPLDAAIRLMLLDVLAVAAAEITRELAPGSVELRLRGGSNPEFAVTAPAPPADPEGAPASIADTAGAAEQGGGEGGVTRINLRLPEQLKARVEQAALREGLSVNAWLVRAAAAAVERGEAGRRPEQAAPRGGRRYTGWGR